MNKKFKGLTSSEADELLRKYGLNELGEQSKLTALQIFLHQFKNFFIVLLFVAAIISAMIGELIDAGIIVLILVLNVVLGFFQEFKAENALASLKKLTTSKVRTIRDGEEQLIDSTLLVPGDVILIAEGDKVPADGTIVSSIRIEINEASLTGESLPVSKSEYNTDKNTVYMGTIVSSGRATVVINHTGKDTKFGSMATSLEEIDKTDTPLTHKITRLGMQLSIGAFVLTILVFIVGVLKSKEMIDMLLTSISLLVAAIPEGLPAVITITLAVGLQRMARRKAILRKLGAIEALGNTSVIATDKTGTLTENKMRVVEIWANEQHISTKDIKSNVQDGTVNDLIRCGIVCNNAKIVQSKKEGDIVLGDQTEGSLLFLAKDNGIDPEIVRSSGKLLDEFSFDSNLKMMSVLWQNQKDKTLYSKGAPEKILEKSTHILVNGKKKKLIKSGRLEIEKAIETAAKNGLRVLALARRSTAKKYPSRNAAEKDLTFLGLAGITDPPRSDVKEVIVQTHKAGILTIMITGDNPLTASYIAKEVGLVDETDCIVTANKLHQMSDSKLKSILKKSCVFARTSPEDKFRIVKLLQDDGHIVTVTGDGINDALALKQADVGVAMGITGTDVAKEVADMVITDDNFASIVNAIREGRIIYDNIVKSITYLVACNLGEMLLIFVAIALGYPVPLLPVQILWVNLVTDGFPALSLAFDPGASDIMNSRRRSYHAVILNRKTIPKVIEYGAIVAIIPLVFFILTITSSNLDAARTAAFSTLVLTQMIVIFFLRPNQKIISNKILLIAVGLSLGIQYLITTIPFFMKIFHISS